MTDYFNRIKYLTQSGRASLTEIVAIPRSVSTFFEISLAEAVDGNQLNEPFFRSPFDKGCQLIYERLIELGAEDPMQKKPVQLIIKDIAGHLKSYNQYLELLDNVIFLIRDPHVMMPSLVQRLAHTTIGQTGGNSVSREEALQHVEDVEILLANKNYTGTSWQCMAALLEQTKAHIHASPGHKKTLSIVDSGLLFINAELILRQLCERLNFTFCPSMLSGEKKAGGAAFCYPNGKPNEIGEDGAFSKSA